MTATARQNDVIAAACAWVDRIQDPPCNWADEEDKALIAAVLVLRWDDDLQTAKSSPALPLNPKREDA